MNADYKAIIREKIKQAVDEDSASLSFFDDMAETELQIPSEFREEEQKTRKRPHRILKAASFVLAVFCCSSIIAVFMVEHGTVQAVKFRVDQFLWSFHEDLVTTQEAEDGSGHSETIMEITDWEDIDEAKKFLEELYVPAYIPEGYEFVSLQITKSMESPYFVLYSYRNNSNNTLSIFQEYTKQIEEGLLSVENIYKKEESSLGTIYFSHDPVFDLYYGILVNGNNLIDVGGSIDEGEILKIIENLNQ